MKRVFYALSLLFFVLMSSHAIGQDNVLDPDDPDVIFTSQNQPPAPTWNQMSKWGHTNRLNWNPYSYGYKSYYFKGMAFRLKFPGSYKTGKPAGQKYPLYLFLHGLGEYAPIYDNELQLVHGGQLHAQKVNNGEFDGFLLYPQSTSGYLNGNMPIILDLLDSLKKYVNMDEDRVIVGGLSSGGQAVWDFLEAHPERYAAATPISAARQFDPDYVASMLSVPVWLANGGQDKGPYPETVTAIVNKYKELGGDIKQSFFPDMGHGVWNKFWAEPGYFEYLKDAHKAQPVVLYQHNEFCPSDPIDAKMILQPGFFQYEWQKDGVTITGATTETYTATQFGSYRARFKRTTTSNWSDWSPRPILVSEKEATVTPPISVDGLHTKVLPAPDGSTTVPLKVPEGYESYDWRRVSDNVQVSTTNTYIAPLGQYKVKVTEKFGCSSSFSDPFIVVNAAGTNIPEKASDVTAVTLSNTSIEIYWNQNPNPAYNETAFEIYRSISSGNNYVLAGIVHSDSLNFVDIGLSPNVKYYYIVRAVNDNGASPNSNEASETTESDNIAPSPPANLKVTGTSRHSVSLKWDESIDDVGIKNYDIYVDGDKAYTTTETEFTVNNLDSFKTYSFYIIAKDLSGNLSVPSSQATGFTKYSGFDFSVYQGNWTLLPNFGNLTPFYTGHSANIDITVSPFTENYGMVWKGYISIPVAGNYTFYLTSDDGSALYLNNQYGPGVTPFILNDGTHGMVMKSASIALTKGVYPIGATFFQGGGGQGLTLKWSCPQAGIFSATTIADQYFADPNMPSGVIPAMPSNLLAVAQAYNKVQLTWNDNSNNETGFEIYRKSSSDVIYKMIALVSGGTQSYSDTLVEGNTVYSYKVQAVNTDGVSGFNPNDLSGVSYNYYEGTWDNLPNFNNLNPVSSGTLDNFSISPRLRDDLFAFKFTGTINVPVGGSYTFYTKSDDGSKLYIDQFNSAGQVVNNDFLQGPTERSGSINLTAGKHIIYVTFFEKTGGEFLEVSWKGPGFPKEVIPDFALRNSKTTITTPAAPPVPDVPVNVTIQVVSKKQVDVAFASTSVVTGYQVYRSLGTNDNFKLFKTLNTTDLNVIVEDSSLFPNTTVFYKVRASGVTGYSDFSDTVTGKTLNTFPVINDPGTQYVYFSGSTIIPISATDEDGDVLTFTVTDLPAFAIFTPTTNGNGTLIFNTAPENLGTYSIGVNVSDGNGGADTKTLNLIVTNNRKPKIGRIRDLVINEGSTGISNILAVDLDRRSQINFQMKGQPDFCVGRIGESGSYTATFNPGYADAGDYSFWLFASDGLGGIDSAKVNVTVNNVDPPSEKVFVNILNTSPAPSAPWNNISGYTTSSLKDEDGQTTSIGLIFNTTNWNTSNLGKVTGDNSGIYPDNVMRDYYFFGDYGIPDTVVFTLNGLVPESKYNLTVFASSTYTSGSTVYESNGQTKTIDAHNNSENAATFYALQSDASGNVSVKMSKALGTQLGYLNAVVLQKPFDDGTPPVAPKQFTASPLSNGNVLLQWKDVAYNEYGYSILRAESAVGPFILLNDGTANANDTTYLDNTTEGNKDYYYKIFAFNNYGNSAEISASMITTINRDPKLETINSLFVKTAVDTSLTLIASDDAGEVLTFETSGLPSFVTLENNGNGLATLHVQPKVGDEGFYQGIKVKVTDPYGATATQQFSITVSDSSYRSVYINFGPPGSVSEPAPWNNYLAYPFANQAISNLSDDANTNSGFNFRFLTQLNGTNNTGMFGYGKGIYPDNVLKTSVYTTSNSTATMQFGGLNPSKKYNIVIMSGLNSGAEDSASFTSGGQTVYVNGRYNTTRSSQLNGLVSDGNGVINVSFTKTINSEYLNINAIEIQEYSGTPIIRPSNLYAYSTLSTDSIKLTWSDRSNSETGYEIWRSTSENGIFSLVSTVSANTTKYTDNSALIPGSTYFYKVKAENGNGPGSFSNIASSSLAENVVLLNLNAESVNDEPLPWNNTDNGPSSEGLVVDNLVNTNFQNSGVSMEITKEFNGKGFAGVSTAGVLPYNVMFTNYWTDASQVSQIKFSNLDQRKKYRVGVFNSVDKYGFYQGNYTINGITRSINGYKNGTDLIYFENISPDENGEIFINVSPDGSSPYCFTSAYTLEGYNPIADDEMPQTMMKSGLNRSQDAVSLTHSVVEEKDIVKGDIMQVSAYPNPFVAELTAQIQLPANVEQGSLELYDIHSRLIFKKEIQNGSVGGSIQTIKIPIAQTLAPGVYFLKLFSNGNIQKTLKLIKGK